MVSFLCGVPEFQGIPRSRVGKQPLWEGLRPRLPGGHVDDRRSPRQGASHIQVPTFQRSKWTAGLSLVVTFSPAASALLGGHWRSCLCSFLDCRCFLGLVPELKCPVAGHTEARMPMSAQPSTLNLQRRERSERPFSCTPMWHRRPCTHSSCRCAASGCHRSGRRPTRIWCRPSTSPPPRPSRKWLSGSPPRS